MAKNFAYDGTDLDNYCEAAFTNFITTAFTGYSPSMTYCTGNYHCGYKRNGEWLNIAKRGYVPSSTALVTNTTRGTWMKIASSANGFTINGTEYYNSSRGKYPYKRVGLVFCGGGGGGGAYITYVENVYGSYRNVDAGGGCAGGGAGTVAVVLNLAYNDFYLYLGTGGAGETSYNAGNAGTGGNSTLKVGSSSGSTLAIAYGGGKGTVSSRGSGGSYYLDTSYDEDTITYLGGIAGGAGGMRGELVIMYDSYEELDTHSYNSPTYCKGGSTSSASYYMTSYQQVTGGRLSLSGSASTGSVTDPLGSSVGYATGGACATYSTYGFGGNGPIYVSDSSLGVFGGAGGAGIGGAARIFY